jgi:hypothetical protein
MISVVFGACLLLARDGSVQPVLTWISIYALTNGLAMAGLALRLRGLRESIHTLAGSRPLAKAAGQSDAA